MNVISRGVKNAARGPLRSGLIVLMLAVSIGLVLAMLVAHSSVESKIKDVEANAGTKVTINAAGISGFAGGGTPLTTDNVATIAKTTHVVSTTSTLTDQLGTSDTNLQSAIDLGSFGARQQRFDTSGSSSTGGDSGFPSTDSSSTDASSRPTPQARISVTGTTNPDSVATNGGSLTIKSGATIDASGNSDVALIGSSLATKNNLKAGDTFTAYSTTITVKGIFSTGNTFADDGIIMPLETVQNLSGQAGAVTSVVATVDSSDNVNSTVSALKSSLGDKVDITSEAQEAADSVSALQSIAGLSMAAVIGAAIAGGAIILLAMIIVVRERRREIGVIKAIGGTNGKVIGQFVAESLTLTIIGAIVGLGLGILVSGPMTSALAKNASTTSQAATTSGADSSGRSSFGGSGSGRSSFAGGAARAFGGGLNQLRSNVTNVTATLTPQIFLSALGITFVVAILGSLIPAWFIARIRPAEVLRTE